MEKGVIVLHLVNGAGGKAPRIAQVRASKDAKETRESKEEELTVRTREELRWTEPKSSVSSENGTGYKRKKSPGVGNRRLRGTLAFTEARLPGKSRSKRNEAGWGPMCEGTRISGRRGFKISGVYNAVEAHAKFLSRNKESRRPHKSRGSGIRLRGAVRTLLLVTRRV